VSRHEGGCLYGDIRFEIAGKIGPIGHCHDPICRKAHSAAFASHAVIPTERFRWTRGEKLIKRFSEDARLCRIENLVRAQTQSGRCRTPTFYS